MKSKALILLAAMVVVLTACGNQTADVPNPTIESNQRTPDIQNTDQVTPDTPDDSAQPFKEGIFVDLTKYKEEVKEEEILEVIKSNLESLITDDQQQYRESFLTDKNADPNMFWFDSTDKYQFNEIESIEHYPDQGSIHVYVLGNSQSSDGTINAIKMMYAFKKSDEGQWKIYTID